MFQRKGDALSPRSDPSMYGPTPDLQHLQCVVEDGANRKLFQDCVGTSGIRYNQMSPRQTSCFHPTSPLVTQPPQDSSNKAGFSISPGA